MIIKVIVSKVKFYTTKHLSKSLNQSDTTTSCIIYSKETTTTTVHYPHTVPLKAVNLGRVVWYLVTYSLK